MRFAELPIAVVLTLCCVMAAACAAEQGLTAGHSDGTNADRGLVDAQACVDSVTSPAAFDVDDWWYTTCSLGDGGWGSVGASVGLGSMLLFTYPESARDAVDLTFDDVGSADGAVFSREPLARAYGDGAVVFAVSAPEPVTAVLLGMGILGLAVHRYRKRC